MIKKSFLLSFCLYTSTLLSNPQALEIFCKKHLEKQYILWKEENDVPDLMEITIPDHEPIDRDIAAPKFKIFCKNHLVNVESYKQHLDKKESQRLEKEKYSIVDSCLVRWRDDIIRETIRQLAIKQKTIEAIDELPLPPAKKIQLQEEKMHDIQQLITAGHQYTEILLGACKNHLENYTMLCGDDDKDTFNLYRVVEGGKALILRE